ncbi:MAG: hypothetical protein M1834_005699 [Cirrosporium novae-zelandiae]|nr:MAG: hypothetical protein M1834_005699 [Cirrosporium novae-zelandiae]
MAAESLFLGVALVTGAASGIGAATAKGFADAGCNRIAITDINEGLLQQTKEKIIQDHPTVIVHAVAGDIADPSFAPSFVTSTVEEFRRLDYCVNCAGIMGNNWFSTATSIEDFDRINNINYRGCWLTSRAELTAMTNQGRLLSHEAGRPPPRGSIVNIASQLGIVGRPNTPVYSASKAAVIAMTRADAIDYSPHGIRVNCICPGVIETPMTTGPGRQIEISASVINIAPMRRMGKPSEVADCAIFLSSTKASFVQGHAMVVDGGYIIN